MVVKDRRSNVKKDSLQPSAAPTIPNDTKVLRRIIAEDPDWSLATVPLLKDLVINHIVDNFEKNPILKELHPKDKNKVLDKIAPKIDIIVTAHLVEDESYWKRCCKAKYHICDVTNYGGSWKRMFFERYMQDVVENFVPEKTSDNVVTNAIPLCSKYVKRLDIKQLLPPVKEPTKPGVQEEEASDMGSDAGTESPEMDHFEFGELLEKLPNLEEFKVTYGVRDCGMNFEWNLFQFTQRDCLLVAKALRSCTWLKKICVHKSKVDDAKVRVLVSNLLDHPCLTNLDLSHNCIGDKGARGIAKLINNRCPNLTSITLCDNIIRQEGAKAIAYSITKNSKLKALNLRLNRMGDVGGQAIAKALLNNNTLEDINLSCNDLTEPSAAVFSQVLISNTALTTISLSGNRIGPDGGKQLQEGMEENSTITELDLRLTESGQESEYCIQQVLKENQEKARLKELERIPSASTVAT
uniref:dynein regulatory complex subunit 5-like n=1 Tax=Styela clava TaxID=7725 RepID=UPI001939B8B5|nr:dynein regulatory complex subunit 5-like [Styela clava]